jgi:alanine racemase
MSHLFAADDVSDVSMNQQIQKFKRMYYKVLDA